MVGTGETYVPAFALALGLGEIEAGLLASGPLLAGSVFQLVSPVAVHRLGSLRRWVVLCAAIQAALFVPLVAAAIAGRIHVAVLYAVVSLYWGFGMATGPAWNAWIETLVPPRIRARYFAARGRLVYLAILIGLVGGGAILHGAAERDRPLAGFAVAFGVAGLARAASAAFLARQREPVAPERPIERTPPHALSDVARSPGGRLLAYMLALQLAVYVSAPFFTPYMLGQLRLTYGEFAALTATAFVARVAVLGALGEAAGRLGARRLLSIGGIGLIPLAALWNVSTNLAYLFVLQIGAGALWATYELATFLLFFETIPRRDRLGVLTWFNLANSIAIVGGSALGGALLAAFGSGWRAYHWIFALSTILRALAAVLLGGVPDIRARVRPHLTRTVAVRPSMGAIERPILPAVPPARRSGEGA